MGLWVHTIPELNNKVPDVPHLYIHSVIPRIVANNISQSSILIRYLKGSEIHKEVSASKTGCVWLTHRCQLLILHSEGKAMWLGNAFICIEFREQWQNSSVTTQVYVGMDQGVPSLWQKCSPWLI